MKIYIVYSEAEQYLERFYSWPEAEAQVKGHRGRAVRSFKTLAEANEFAPLPRASIQLIVRYMRTREHLEAYIVLDELALPMQRVVRKERSPEFFVLELVIWLLERFETTWSRSYSKLSVHIGTDDPRCNIVPLTSALTQWIHKWDANEWRNVEKLPFKTLYKQIVALQKSTGASFYRTLTPPSLPPLDEQEDPLACHLP